MSHRFRQQLEHQIHLERQLLRMSVQLSPDATEVHLVPAPLPIFRER